MGSLHSPLDLCERLGLRPTDEQYVELDKFAFSGKSTHLTGHPMLKVAGVCALWRLLTNEGSQVTVISSRQELARQFMSFVHDITTTIDPTITSLCKWKSWRIMSVDNRPGYQLRYIPNQPEQLQGWGHDPRGTWVVLGADSMRRDFNSMVEVMGHQSLSDETKIINFW